jgi:hypothetical protein
VTLRYHEKSGAALSGSALAEAVAEGDAPAHHAGAGKEVAREEYNLVNLAPYRAFLPLAS